MNLDIEVNYKGETIDLLNYCLTRNLNHNRVYEMITKYKYDPEYVLDKEIEYVKFNKQLTN